MITKFKIFENNVNNEEEFKLVDFDRKFFNKISGKDSFNALNFKSLKNVHYFTVINAKNIPVGIIGIYDTNDDKYISHTVVKKEYRGKFYSKIFKDLIIKKLNLPYLTLTIDINNTNSVKSALKLQGIKKVSDENYEKKYHKYKFIYK